MPFDFDAAVSAPFRMQPGLRKLAPGALQLTPLQPGSRHQREKLAVLSAFWQQALQQQSGFDGAPALASVCAQAALEHPHAWAWDGHTAQALLQGAAVAVDAQGYGTVQTMDGGSFGLGDEVTRCLQGLPAAWRLTGLLALAFAEDLAVIDGTTGCIPWLAVALPSFWAPEDKVGLHFTQVHAPVADNQLLIKAAEGITRLVTGTDRWERFVWNITDHPRLHAHPAHVEQPRWQHTRANQAFWRTERQTFIPVQGLAAGLSQAVFTIEVNVQPLAQSLHTKEQATALHAAVASMSADVLAYRSLATVREPLLAWLAQRMELLAAAPQTAAPA
jgi:dimethylamine monooxygenase subunit A